MEASWKSGTIMTSGEVLCEVFPLFFPCGEAGASGEAKGLKGCKRFPKHREANYPGD